MAFGFIDFAKEVLEASDRPLSVEELWERGCKQGLDESRNISENSTGYPQEVLERAA